MADVCHRIVLYNDEKSDKREWNKAWDTLKEKKCLQGEKVLLLN